MKFEVLIAALPLRYDNVIGWVHRIITGNEDRIYNHVRAKYRPCPIELHNWLRTVIQCSAGILNFVNLTADFAVCQMCVLLGFGM